MKMSWHRQKKLGPFAHRVRMRMKAKNQAMSFRKKPWGKKPGKKNCDIWEFLCLAAGSISLSQCHMWAHACMLRFPQKHAWARIFISHLETFLLSLSIFRLKQSCSSEDASSFVEKGKILHQICLYRCQNHGHRAKSFHKSHMCEFPTRDRRSETRMEPQRSQNVPLSTWLRKHMCEEQMAPLSSTAADFFSPWVCGDDIRNSRHVSLSLLSMGWGLRTVAFEFAKWYKTWSQIGSRVQKLKFPMGESATRFLARGPNRLESKHLNVIGYVWFIPGFILTAGLFCKICFSLFPKCQYKVLEFRSLLWAFPHEMQSNIKPWCCQTATKFWMQWSIRSSFQFLISPILFL